MGELAMPKAVATVAVVMGMDMLVMAVVAMAVADMVAA